MNQRVKDGIFGAALILVLLALWQVWSLINVVQGQQHDLMVIVGALQKAGILAGPPNPNQPPSEGKK